MCGVWHSIHYRLRQNNVLLWRIRRNEMNKKYIYIMRPIVSARIACLGDDADCRRPNRNDVEKKVSRINWISLFRVLRFCRLPYEMMSVLLLWRFGFSAVSCISGPHSPDNLKRRHVFVRLEKSRGSADTHKNARNRWCSKASSRQSACLPMTSVSSQLSVAQM